MTEIRRLRAEEIPAAKNVKTIAFNGRRDPAKEANKVPDPLEHPPGWTWGCFEGGKILSAITEIEYLMRFDNHDVSMSGIGGVATLPETRKGGLVRSIFEKLLPEAYEKGVVFSCLRPFSHAFYRKFGYELACVRNKITIPIREFSGFKLRGEFTQVFPGDDTSALNDIHRNYIAGLNHGIYRDHWPDNRGWKAFIKDDPYVTGTYTYLWRNEGGKPGGYIKFQHTKNKEANMMYVSDLAFLDQDALYGVLSFAGVMGAQFKVFQWLMPAFLDPADFVHSIWDIEQQIIPTDMTRVVNVKAALEKMRRPTNEGAYAIEVNDEIISANRGRFLVEYSPDETRVSITQKEPDISCDMPVLSQLITGYRTLENALRTRQTGLEIHGNKETLARVFTLRPQHQTEYF